MAKLCSFTRKSEWTTSNTRTYVNVKKASIFILSFKYITELLQIVNHKTGGSQLERPSSPKWLSTFRHTLPWDISHKGPFTATRPSSLRSNSAIYLYNIKILALFNINRCYWFPLRICWSSYFSCQVGDGFGIHVTYGLLPPRSSKILLFISTFIGASSACYVFGLWTFPLKWR